MKCHWSTECDRAVAAFVEWPNGRRFAYCAHCMATELPATSSPNPQIPVKVTPLENNSDDTEAGWDE